MLKAVLFILSISLFFFSTLDAAANNIRQSITSQSTVFEYFHNDDKAYSIREIQQLKSSEWISEKKFKTDGLTNHHYWLHVRVTLNTKTVEPLFLEVKNLFIDKISVYLFRGQQSLSYTTGNSIKTDDKPVAVSSLYFPLPNNNAEFVDIYIEHQDETHFQLPLAITDHKESLDSVNIKGIFVGMIIGLIAVLLLIAFIIYREKKSSLLQYYSGLLIFSAITILSLEGVTSHYLWSSFPWLQSLLIPSLLLLTLWLSIGLIKSLLSEKIMDYPFIEFSFKWISRVIITISPILLMLPSAIASITAVIILCILAITIPAILVTFTVQSKIKQTWLINAWLALIVTLILKTINFVGFFQVSSLIMTITTAFYCLQLLIWGAIILQNYNAKKIEQHEQKNQLINDLQTKNQEANNSIAQHYQEHIDLESVINERTFELNVTLHELQDTNRQLQEQATNDALTGVKNRKFFDQRLQAEYRLSRRQHTPISLLLLDADKFKLINDNHGHLAGDKVLIEIAKTANGILKRPNDYVCRYGGEEFAILLSHTDEKGALKVADSIRQKIEEATIMAHSERLTITVSIGIAVLMIDKSTPETLLFEQADKALYFAKESGRNNVKSYNEFKLSNNN